MPYVEWQEQKVYYRSREPKDTEHTFFLSMVRRTWDIGSISFLRPKVGLRLWLSICPGTRSEGSLASIEK